MKPPSKKQTEIMRLICDATARGQEISLVELHESLSYGKDCSRSAVHCSVKFLIKRGYLTKTPQPGPRSMYLTPTAAGFEEFKAVRL